MTKYDNKKIALLVIPIIIMIFQVYGGYQSANLDSYESDVIIDSTFLLNRENAANHNYIKANTILQLLSLELAFTDLNESDTYQLYLSKSQDAKTLTDEAEELLKEEGEVLIEGYYDSVEKMNNQRNFVYWVNVIVWLTTIIGVGLFIFIIFDLIEIEGIFEKKEKPKKKK